MVARQRCPPRWQQGQQAIRPHLQAFLRSGRRVSNPRPSAWEADALPTELRPRAGKSPANVHVQPRPDCAHRDFTPAVANRRGGSVTALPRPPTERSSCVVTAVGEPRSQSCWIGYARPQHHLSPHVGGRPAGRSYRVDRPSASSYRRAGPVLVSRNPAPTPRGPPRRWRSARTAGGRRSPSAGAREAAAPSSAGACGRWIWRSAPARSSPAIPPSR